MKANLFSTKKSQSKEWKPVVSPLLPKALKTAAIGTLSASLGIAGALVSYQFSEHNALRQAMQLTQDFDLYTSNPERLQLNIKSVFDSRFAFASEEAKKSNEFFIRDAVIHRHDLACGRDMLYMKEAQKKGQTYLGCSIQAGTYSDGAHINTYAIGEEFSVTSSEKQAEEFKEYQLHFTFPRDFQDRMMAGAGQSRNNALELARFAIDIYVETQGQATEIMSGGPDRLQKIAKRGGYFERWMLNGGEPVELLKGLQLLGALPSGENVNIHELTSKLTKHLEGIDIRKVSVDERMTMVTQSTLLQSRPTIEKIKHLLDHTCSMIIAPTARDGFMDQNKNCASELGLQMSPQLAASLIPTETIKQPGPTQVHGENKSDKFILGTYKGHPVITSLTKLSDEYAAYVQPGSTEGDSWSDMFVSQTFGAYDSVDAHAGTYVSRKAIEKIHFGAGYDPKHTPIFVDPKLLESMRADLSDDETQLLIIEKVLEHEIKHILDHKVFIETGLGTNNLSMEKQQIACDLYAVEVMAKKYDDPDKLRKLRDLMSSWKVPDSSSPKEHVTSVIGGASRIQDALDLTRQLEKLKRNQGIDTVLQFIDQKIQEKTPLTAPSQKSSGAPRLN